MMISTVPSEIYKGAGWAVCTIVDGAVVSARYLDAVSDDAGHAPAWPHFRAAYEAMDTDPVTLAAEAAADAADKAVEAAEAAGADEDELEPLNAEFERLAVIVRHGMMSGTEFHHTFSKTEERRFGFAPLAKAG